MAIDKLMNQTQGEDIISKLGNIATTLENVTTVEPAKFGMGYAVCNTAAGTAAKTANIANYTLTEGALVTVKFTNGNTASNTTLNISSTGAKPLLYKGSALTTDIISAGDICTFIYSTANSGSYNIINVDALSGAGAGTVKSVGAEGGIITDQTSGAAISTIGSVKLNLKSNTAYTGTVSDPATTNKVYPVALDGDGHPCVGVPWTDTTYTQASNSAITVNNTDHTIDVATGSTSTVGVVQLEDSTASTSTTTAATPNAVKSAYDLASTASSTANSKYSLPSGGITTSDLASGVTASLGKADTAVQTINGDGGAISTSGDGTTKTVSHSTSAGYKHIPAAGSTGQFLGYDSAGTAKWVNNPNTDTKVNVTLATTSKAYLLGTTTAPTSTATGVTSVADTKVYLDTAAGKLTASTINAGSFTGNGVTTSATSGSSALITSGGVYTALSGKQNSLSTSQLAAVNSGIDSTKVGQISTNKSNILYALEKIGTNLIKPRDDLPTVVTALPEGIRIQRKNTTSSFAYVNCGTVYLESGKKYVLYDATYSPTTKHHYFYVDCGGNGFVELSTPSLTATVQYGTGRTTGTYDIYTRIDANTTVDTISTPIICLESVWKQLDAYTPYGAPNYDLTRLEAEDRAGLIDVVDGGAKNILPQVTYNKENYGVKVVPNSDGGYDVSITGSSTSDFYYQISDSRFDDCIKLKLPVGNYVLRADNSSNNIYVYISLEKNGSVIQTDLATSKNGSAHFAITTTDYDCFRMAIYVKPGTTGSYTINPMICTKAAFGVSQEFVPFGNDPFYQVPINHNMIYRGRNLGDTLTDAQHTALSSGNFTDLYLGDYWTKTVTIPAGTYTGGDGGEVTVPAQTNITLKAVIADFDTFYAGYASTYAGINTHHAAVIVTGFSNVVWNKTNSTAGGYVASLIHKWLVGSVLPQIETWFGSAKVLSHQKLLTNAITGDAASGWAWSSQKIALLSENQMYGSKIWGGSKATNGGYEPGEAFKHLNVFNHIDANLLFGNKNIWLRDIASPEWAACLIRYGNAYYYVASYAGIAPAALILLS